MKRSIIIKRFILEIFIKLGLFHISRVRSLWPFIPNHIEKLVSGKEKIRLFNVFGIDPVLSKFIQKLIFREARIAFLSYTEQA